MLDLNEKLPTTPRMEPRPPLYSPKWVALHEDVPRYVYHVPEGKVAFGKLIKAYKIQEPGFADSFGRGYKEYRYVWLSLTPIYVSDAYVIDITRLRDEDLRFTGQVEGNLLHKGDIPASAVVAIRKAYGEIVERRNTMRGYKLTPKGIILLGAFNGLVKRCEETNTTPIELTFDEDTLLSMSQPQLSYEGARSALRMMVFGGMAKKA